MAVSNDDERRKHSRVGFTTQIEIRLEADGRKVSLEGSSRDLSLKGLFITTQEKFTCGTKCIVKIYLTGGIDKIKLQMKATIARVSDNGMGIGFDSMDVDSYAHLKNIVCLNSLDDSA